MKSIKDKLIVTVAPTGNVPTKEMNPYTPVTVKEIVETVRQVVSMGVSVAHLHIRDENQRPTCDRKTFEALVKAIKEEPFDVITQLSTGARGGANTFENRSQMLDLDVEMASLATGSSNFPTSVNSNDPSMIKDMALKMKEHNIKPEIEVFDVAMIQNAVWHQKKGNIVGPLHFNLVMNVPGSIKGTPENLMFLINSLPADSTFTVSGIGSSQIQMLTMAILMGGHVRTGIEDVTQMPDGSHSSNVKLVQQVLDIANSVGREIATVSEARKILSLK